MARDYDTLTTERVDELVKVALSNYRTLLRRLDKRIAAMGDDDEPELEGAMMERQDLSDRIHDLMEFVDDNL